MLVILEKIPILSFFFLDFAQNQFQHTPNTFVHVQYHIQSPVNDMAFIYS
jgi:hypothetical protein